MGDQNLIDKSMRSVFVGNIPYEATEEKLKDIFSEVGPVLSFKLVFDRETGKPKGYGFCEYKDTETALSAMRNLNGYEIGGRTLRVDNACTEKSRLEMQTLLQSTPAESPYGEPVNAEKAPEAISKAVASMPPEQMYELMKQMKECVQNNPIEARTMLLQNPQLSYALLQGLVVMKVIDPNTAVAMLHKVNPSPVPLISSDKPMTVPLAASTGATTTTTTANPATTVAPPQLDTWAGTLPPSVPIPSGPARPSAAPGFLGVQDMDMRQPVDPRIARMADQDLRIPQAAQPPMAHPTHPGHPTVHPAPHPVPVPVPHPTAHPPQNFPSEHYPARDPRIGSAPERFPSRDPRDRVDPRTGTAPIGPAPRPVPVPPVVPRMVPPVATGAPPNLATAGASDQEKAALIMQVLQLTDEQIGVLPPDQRQSILLLKEQIAKSAQR